METKRPAMGRRLSGVDAAFLYLESKEIPLNIGVIFTFEGPIPFKDLVASVESKLQAWPKYRQIAVPPPFDLGYPVWEEDPHFDVNRHFFQVRLDPPGGRAQLEALAGQLFGQLMDRSKPLWDVHVVKGCEGGRDAIILRIQHSLADGVGAVDFLKLFLDPTPEVASPTEKTAPPRRTRARKQSIASALGSGIRSSLDHLIAAEAGIMGIAQSLLGDRSTLDGVVNVLPEVVGAVERLPFNKPCGPERKFCGTEIDLARVQAVRAAVGAKVNDVALSVLTRAVARYVEEHGQTVVKRLIRVVCPVNIRQDNGESIGNQITFIPVVLPLDVTDPLEMLRATAARTAIMKKARAADVITVAASCLGVTLPAVQAMMWRAMSQVMLPLPLFNMIFTNVMGPNEPVYCVGRRMVAAYPSVPTGYECGINCAVYSYNGKLYFGLIGDAQVAADLTRLRDLVAESFEELCAAAGLAKPAAETTAPKAQKPKTAKATRPRAAKRRAAVEEPAKTFAAAAR